MTKQNYISSHPGYEELRVSDYLTHRLFLVTPDVNYAKNSLVWISDKLVGRYMGADFSVASLEGEKKRLADLINDKDSFNWIIECDGKPIGNISISDIKKTSDEFGEKAGSLNYIIGARELWGKGITSSAAKSILEWAFKNGFKIVKSRVIPQNRASETVLKKLGFSEYGREDYDGPDIGEKTWYITYKIVKS